MRFGTEELEPAAAPLAAPRPPAKRIRQGSPQQEAFWVELSEGAGHVLLEARAGTGKSSSCREGMWRLLADRPGLAVRYCCFNKAIADEFGADCPGGVEVGTMHRFGLLSLQRAFGSKLDKLKTYTVLDQIPGGSDLKRYVRKSVATLVSHAKNHGFIPRPGDEDKDLDRLWGLAVAFDVETFGQTGNLLEFAWDCLHRSAEMTTVVDFDDMLWLPVVHGLSFPSVDFLFIDECQDLNPVQHQLAELMSGSGRTVIVGDPYQAIYGWRGAATDSIPRLRDQLRAKVLPLTVTWRCPQSHVRMARELVADFEAAPGAPEGILLGADREAIDRATPGDLVLCRANAPIVSACLRAVASHTPAFVRGRAIGEDLARVLNRIDRLSAPRTTAELVRGVSLWRAKELERLEAKDGTEDLVEKCNDQAACLEALAGSCGTPAELPGLIADLFSDTGSAHRVTFSSVHRAKGSEARRVLFLDIPHSEHRDRLKPPQPWELEQRRNLRYVALTRSLDSLTLVA